MGYEDVSSGIGGGSDSRDRSDNRDGDKRKESNGDEGRGGERNSFCRIVFGNSDRGEGSRERGDWRWKM